MFLAAAILFLTVAVVSSSLPNSIIWWGKSKLVEKISVGQTQEVEIVFTSRKDLGEVNLSVSNDLSKFISSFEPVTLEVVKDQPNKINVLINVPSDVNPDTYGGTIHLREGKRTIGNPLAVNIIVIPAQEPILPVLPTWTDPVNISNTFISSYRPKILQDQLGNVYVFWLDSDYSSQYKLYFSKLEGNVWSSPFAIVNNNKENALSNFDFTIDNQNQIHLAYVQKVLGEGFAIYYIFFDGINWSTPQKFNAGSYPSIEAGPDDKVHMVYSLNSDIFYSNFDGLNWSSPLNVSNDSSYENNTYGAKSIRVDQLGNIHIAWVKHAFGIMYTKFNNNDWQEPQLISQLDLGLDNVYWLSLGANGVVAVAYTQGPNDCINQEIYFSLSEDGGLSWYSPIQISETPGVGSRWPSLLIISPNNVQAVWDECQMGVPFRLYNGNNWSNIIDISNGLQSANFPNISGNKNNSFIVWGFNNDIYFSQSE